MIDLVAVLEKHILSHKMLKLEDNAVISQVCYQIRIEDDPGKINEYHRTQVGSEAAMVYLTSKYGELVVRLKKKRDSYLIQKSLELGSTNEIDGKKWTSKKAKQEWILMTDPDFALLAEKVDDAANLASLVQGLFTIVFGRNDKLEQLSINYRREAEIDRRTTE